MLMIPVIITTPLNNTQKNFLYVLYFLTKTRMTLNDTYGRSEYTKKEKALEERKKAQHMKVIEGRAKAAVDYVVTNAKQMTLKEIDKYLKEERSKVATDFKDRYNIAVSEGLKEFLRNYFLTK